jgi:predicted NUDIX family NTP pyrophosphohydrolase
LVLERNNSSLNWDSFELKCNSFVPEDRGGFPEMDDYKWVSLDEARVILHNTQVACLDKIKELLYGNN